MGVLATVIVVGLLAPAATHRAVPVRTGVSAERNAREGIKQGQRSFPTDALLRYEVTSKSLPFPPASTEGLPSIEAINHPALTSELRLRARFSDDERTVARLEAALTQPDKTPSWMAVLGNWMGGRQGGLGVFVPKWSSCPQLIAHGEATTGWGMGLQYRLNF